MRRTLWEKSIKSREERASLGSTLCEAEGENRHLQPKKYYDVVARERKLEGRCSA